MSYRHTGLAQVYGLGFWSQETTSPFDNLSSSYDIK